MGIFDLTNFSLLFHCFRELWPFMNLTFLNANCSEL